MSDKCISLYCLVRHQLNTVLQSHRIDLFHSRNDRVLVSWVSTWKIMEIDKSEKIKTNLSHYSFAKSYQYILLQYFQFDFPKDQVYWFSVEKQEYDYLSNTYEIYFTVLFRKTSDKYCAPMSPIPFLERFSLVIIYDKWRHHH
jgi:hypothetical protein